MNFEGYASSSKGEHQSWIQEVQHRLFGPKIYITAVFDDIYKDDTVIWREI